MERGNERKRLWLCVAEFLLIMSCFLPAFLGTLFSSDHRATASFFLLTLVTTIHLSLNQTRAKAPLTHQLSHLELKSLWIFGCVMLPVSLAYSAFLFVMAVQYETEINFAFTNYYFVLVSSLVSNFWYALLVYEIRSCW